MTLSSLSLLVGIISLVLTFLHYFIKKPGNLLLCYVQNFVGVLFIISGFVKGEDPLGFSYKLEEYFEVFADYAKQGVHDISAFRHFINLIIQHGWVVSLMDWFKGYSLLLSIFMTVLEMALGWLLIFGIRMRFTAWMLLLLILFFTFLTFFSWKTGKITDCGCFGDFIKFSNAETFYKDVFLTILIIIIFFSYQRIIPLFSGRLSNYLFVLGFAGSIFVSLYCYNYLPWFDFRAYKVGNDIRQQMTPPAGPPDSTVTTLIYKNKQTGEKKGYLMKDLPWADTVWTANNEFVTQNSVVVREGPKAKITDFKVWTDSSPDITTEVLDKPGFKVWIIAYDITRTNKSAFKDIDALANDCQKHGITVVGLTASPYEITDPFRHDVQAAFPFYYSDGTVLKTMVRANPGIMLLNGSKVLGMWHYHRTPTYDKLNKEFFHQ